MSKSSIITVCVVLMAIASGCESNTYDGVRISEGLDNVLTEYIETNDKDSVINLYFDQIEDHIIMTIWHYPLYMNPYDGCFRKQGKLITYFSFRKSIADSLISPYNTKNQDVIAKYHSNDDIGMDYDGDLGICEYRVMSKEQIRKATEDDFHCKEKVTDKTVIKNAALNKMINDRLNGNSVQLTNIHFFTENNQICFWISNGNAYIRNNLKGCLYRNGRMIAFYSENDNITNDIVDVETIRKNLPLLSSYREFPKSRAVFLASRDNFKIISNDSIEQIVDEEEE